MRAVSDEIATAVHAVDPDRVDRPKARLERRQVAVDVGNDRDAIQRWPPGPVHVDQIPGDGHQCLEQVPHAVIELVANPPHDLERLPQRDRRPRQS